MNWTCRALSGRAVVAGPGCRWHGPGFRPRASLFPGPRTKAEPELPRHHSGHHVGQRYGHRAHHRTPGL